MRYERLPHRVRVERLSAPWVWTTPNGDRIVARAGDFRVTDVASGFQWSIAPGALSNSYRALGGDVYEAGGSVSARRIQPCEVDESIVSLEGREVAKPGDWVLEDAEGNHWIVQDSWFRKMYRLVAT